MYGPMVKRLRHRPFTAVTRVRVPVGSPNPYDNAVSFLHFLRLELSALLARMAELADALDLGSSGRPWGFKSLYAHQTNIIRTCFR